MDDSKHIGIPSWQERVSPVFDVARSLVVLRVERGRIVNRYSVDLEESTFGRRVARLQVLDIDLLICGAISRPLARLLTGLGIEVMAGISGSVEDVIDSYLQGRLPDPSHTMPGFRCLGRQRRMRNRSFRQMSGRGKRRK